METEGNVSGLSTKCPFPDTPDRSSSLELHILYVDDDPDVLKAAELLLKRRGMQMTSAKGPEEAWGVLTTKAVDVVLLDLNFRRGANDGSEGLRHLSEILSLDASAAIVVVTAHSGVNVAVEAMRRGASDFVMKPWNNDRLVATLLRAAHARRDRITDFQIRDASSANEPIIGSSHAVEAVRRLITKTASTEAPVMIWGAEGVGKGFVAHHIHLQSRRATGPYCSVDFSALTPDEADKTLFGRSNASEPGLLDSAAGGTILLDELGAMPASVQSRLSQHLDAQALHGRLGLLHVRIISTSRRPRAELLEQGKVQRDLFFRLSAVEIEMPTLRYRRADIVQLAKFFLRHYEQRYNKPARILSSAAEGLIVERSWPAEARGLRRALERAVIFSEDERYDVVDFPAFESVSAENIDGNRSLDLEANERTLISAALKRAGFNVSLAAKDLGLSRAALYRRMAKHGL